MLAKVELTALWRQALANAEQSERSGASAHVVLKQISAAADALIGELAQSCFPSQPNNFTICAVGGYGRQQLHPHSDIDLLFLYNQHQHLSETLKKTTETVLYALWDIGLKVGHASRSISECIKLGRDDITIRTNLLDIRQIWGDSTFYASAKNELERELHRYRLTTFARQKIKELEERRKRYGEFTYLLEPNIKESPGGLRDIQTAYWIAKAAFRTQTFAELFPLGVLAEDDANQLDRHFEKLLAIRNRLHFRSKKPIDQLTMQAQRDVAADLGFVDNDEELGSEAFMRSYYELSRETRQGVDIALETFMERLDPPSRTLWFRRKRHLGDSFYLYRERIHGARVALEANPPLLLRAFRLSQKTQAPLSFELKRTLRVLAPKLKHLTPEQAQAAAKELRAILQTPKDIFEILNEMNETGVLRAYLPEFEHQYCRVQHDTYHIYTADQHLFVCTKVWADLQQGHYQQSEPEIQEIALRLKEPLAMTLAVLLHDIGKGYGGDHSIKGAALAENMCQKLGIPTAQIKIINQLIREHLTLSHIAQRRDLSDHRVIKEFTAIISDVDTLDMLLVLTFCDQNGVGPGVWTPWKRSLMLQLHDAARLELEREDIGGVYLSRIEKNKAKLKQDLANALPSADLDQFLAAMAPRFFVRHDAVMLSEVVRAFAEGLQQGVAVRIVPDAEFGGQIILVAPDKPGVFAFQAGLFSLADMSIVNAEGYTLPGLGWAVNLFYVKSLDPLFFAQPQRIERFRQSLLAWLNNPREASSAIQKRLAEPIPAKPHSRRRIRVRINKDLSEKYTVFEVAGWDRIGLLHQLATVFFEEGCDIWLARIHTEGQRVSDIFYIQDQAGGPINDPVRLDRITNRLFAVVNI